jgi:ribosomal protein S12 methylthiotransferase accessory factor YcaO
MKAEQERIKRQQQYLGAAMGQIEQMRAEQMTMARERQAESIEKEKRESGLLYKETCLKDRQNKSTVIRLDKQSREDDIKEKDKQYQYERKQYLAKLKQEVILKKEMFREGQAQHVATKTVLVEHNPYAERTSQESLTKIKRTNNFAN